MNLLVLTYYVIRYAGLPKFSFPLFGATLDLALFDNCEIPVERTAGAGNLNTGDKHGLWKEDIKSSFTVIVEHDDQIWIQSGSVWPQLEQIREFPDQILYILAHRPKMY